MPWKVYKEDIKKDLKRMRGNSSLKKGLDRFLDDVKGLAEGEDPADLGDEKLSKRFDDCRIRWLTKSYRLVFKVDYGEREIHLIMMGDHKKVYGYD